MTTATQPAPDAASATQITTIGGRVKTRPPSFINYATMSRLLEGHMLADTVAILGSLNIVAAELDR